MERTGVRVFIRAFVYPKEHIEWKIKVPTWKGTRRRRSRALPQS